MAALTLPKAGRLARRSEFNAVRAEGKSWHGNLMVIGGWLSGQTGPARLGVITSRKTGSAVERNRTRRRLREIFRLHRPLLPTGLWLVVIARRSAAKADYHALAEEWRALTARAGYLEV